MSSSCGLIPWRSLDCHGEGVDVASAVVAEEKGSIVGVEAEPEADGADEMNVAQIDDQIDLPFRDRYPLN
jgi:hypothetical protein